LRLHQRKLASGTPFAITHPQRARVMVTER